LLKVLSRYFVFTKISNHLV